MAGRPRMKAKRVAQLYEAYCVLVDELQMLMPAQYRQPTIDSLGRTWQQAVRKLGDANDNFMDLVAELGLKAERAEERAAARSAVIPAEADTQ